VQGAEHLAGPPLDLAVGEAQHANAVRHQHRVALTIAFVLVRVNPPRAA
jgi:hypothetical protein